MTGNTEEMANLIKEGIIEENVEVDIKDSLQVFTEDLLNYDGILLGSYTWNEGELPDEFLDFYEELNQLDLSGKISAAFGSGDKTYPDFCRAVDILTNRLTELGSHVVHSGLKIEHFPDGEEREYCRRFGRQFADSLVNAVQLA